MNNEVKGLSSLATDKDYVMVKDGLCFLYHDRPLVYAGRNSKEETIIGVKCDGGRDNGLYYSTDIIAILDDEICKLLKTEPLSILEALRLSDRVYIVIYQQNVKYEVYTYNKEYLLDDFKHLEEAYIPFTNGDVITRSYMKGIIH